MLRRCLALTLVSGLGCSTAPSPRASRCEDLDWLVGAWQADDSREHWQRQDDGSLRGRSEQLRDGTVVYTEALAIVRTDAGVEYRAAPEDQAPNVFVLEHCEGQTARFADPEHDWPQTITYHREGDGLTATVSGEQDGHTRTATWSWTR